jgi:nucleotide-binding universal stress UspA family protein
VTIEHIKFPEFQPLSIKHILLPVRSGTQTETVQVACELAKFHRAKLTAINIIEVPFSIPLDTQLSHRVEIAGGVLKITEAIARDYGIDADMQIIRARSTADALLSLLRRGTFDLIVLGALKTNNQEAKGIGAVTERILKESPCRVWVCGSEFSSAAGRKDILMPK